MSVTPFISASGRARTAIAFLYLTMAMDALTSAVTSTRLLSTGNADPGLVEAPMWFLFVVGTVASIVFFLTWMHRAYSNLPALGATRLRFTPGWAVGSFFVPFANLIHPLYAMREIWHHSRGIQHRHLHAHGYSVPILGAWWATHLASNFLSNTSFRMSLAGDSAQQALSAEWCGIAGSLLSVVTGFLIISIIRKIDVFQTAAHNAQQTPVG